MTHRLRTAGLACISNCSAPYPVIVNPSGPHSVRFVLDFNRRSEKHQGFSFSPLETSKCLHARTVLRFYRPRTDTETPRMGAQEQLHPLVPAGARTEPQGGTVQEQWCHYESNGQGLGLTTRPHHLRTRRARSSLGLCPRMAATARAR